MQPKRAIIIYEKYYDFEKDRVLAGGVQTYISNLIPILREAGYDCRVYQFGKKDKTKQIELENCLVQVVPNSIINLKYKSEVILEYIKNVFDTKNDLLIFADHILTVKNEASHSIAIQHGIHWDVEKAKNRSDLKMFLSKARFSYHEYQRIKYVKRVICVDYNFLNWYRTQVDIPDKNIVVIPNFTKIASLNIKSEETIKIIFARRFVPHRGTRVFTEVAERLLKEYDNIEITVAGRGPDEEYLHNRLDKWGRKVLFIHYKSEDSLLIHADKNIAVVPTVGSEGTSLSLLEAMSSQCAVVCTDVGGMTNIILNNYNGKMVSAGNIDELYMAMKELIENQNFRERISEKGYETVKSAFSYERWSSQWRNIIHDYT